MRWPTVGVPRKIVPRVGTGLVYAWNAMRTNETILTINLPTGPVEIL